jgi:hypothetical protein
MQGMTKKEGFWFGKMLSSCPGESSCSLGVAWHLAEAFESSGLACVDRRTHDRIIRPWCLSSWYPACGRHRQFPDRVYFQSRYSNDDTAGACADCYLTVGIHPHDVDGRGYNCCLMRVYDACRHTTKCNCFWFRLSQDMGYDQDWFYHQPYRYSS